MDSMVDTYSTRPFPCYQTLYPELTHKVLFKLNELSLVKVFYCFVSLNAIVKLKEIL